MTETKTTEKKPKTENKLAILKKETVDVVAERIRQFQESGELHFPANYSPENAMKSAWLIIQKVEDRNNKPALEVCTKASIANALLDMVVQGLNPAKKQCYCSVYGKELVCQRSYFGTMAVTKQLTAAVDILAQVVYEDDDFEYELSGGRKIVTKHTQKLTNIDPEKIVAAYCEIYFPDREPFTDIMTFDQIKKAWQQSKMKPITDAGKVKAGSTHADFAADMTIKTVVNHACKFYLNTSDDSGLVMEHIRRADDLADAAAVAAEIEENANGDVLDIEPIDADETPAQEAGADKPEGVDLETGEILEVEPVEAAKKGPGY